jgi:hypothetical protein
LELPLSVGDVVANGIPEDVIQGFGFRDIAAGLSNHGDKLALIVQARAFLSQRVNWDGICGTGERSEGFVLLILALSIPSWSRTYK